MAEYEFYDIDLEASQANDALNTAYALFNALLSATNGQLLKKTSSGIEFNGIQITDVSQLVEALAEKISDAPSDNMQYARKNGTWSEVEATGGGSWGTITGDIQDQTDLQNELSGKQKNIYQQDSAPSNPQDGDIWIDTDEVPSGGHSVIAVDILTTDWSSKSATVSVSGVTASNILVVSPAPSSFLAYGESQVRATAQASGTVTFACETEPSEDLVVNVMIVG